MRSLAISSSFQPMLLLALICSCSTTLPQYSTTSEWPGDGLVAPLGLAFGRFQLEVSHAEIELHNEITGDRYHHSLHESGRFYWELPGGHYEITQIWMGFRSLTFETDSGPRFHVVPGKIIYLGTLALRSPSDSQIGSLDILNDYLIEKQHLYARYQTVATNEPPLEGLMYVLPPNETGGMFLDIIVNNHLLKPFLIDTGATLTVITRQTARELGISDWWTFPRKEFLTGGGRIKFPVSQVASIQVGNNVVKDVEVAIDVDEHFPYGLLGMNVLQHFQVVLDKKRQQVRLIP